MPEPDLDMGICRFNFDLFPPEVQKKLKSLDEVRVQDCDKGGVDLQVVSLIPAAETLSICEQANDQLAAAVAKSKGRLAGFAALPMGSPSEAAQELERCVRSLGFLGALIPNHVNGTHFHGQEYRVFWSKAQELDVPIYLHPSPPTPEQYQEFDGLPGGAQVALSQFAWHWHEDVARHFLKLYAGGLFEEGACPRLKVILGHAGEMLPFMAHRSDRMFGMVWKQDSLNRSLETVWRSNVYITLSGMWDLAPLSCLLRTIGIDKVMYSLDYPFENPLEGLRFMEDVKKSGLLTAEEFEMIEYRNAEKLLKVNKPRLSK